MKAWNSDPLAETWHSHGCTGACRAGSGGMSRAGFTLIEILVAVAVLSVGVVAIFTALHVCVLALEQSRYTMRAGALLQEKLETLSENGGEIEPDTGQFSSPDDDFQWRVDVSGEETDRSARLETVTVTVWSEGRTEKSVQTRFYTRRRE
jgi:prepilin-type N-terminal cleavage/methylation domain-containing protein